MRRPNRPARVVSSPKMGVTPPQPVTDDPGGLQITLSDATAPVEAPPKPPVAGEPMSDADVDALLARLPALDEQAGDRKDAAIRPASLAPPRAGVTRRDPWPPPSAGPAPTPKTEPLAILRHSPDGDIPLAARVSVAFSQAMVPVTSHAQAEATIPARLTPQPPGAWRWAGSQLLIFEGPDAGRLPMATRYEIVIPAGTRSEAGGALAKEERFTFTTPPPRMQQFQPYGSPQGLDPLMIATFDQRIDPAKVFERLTLRAGGQRVDAVLKDINAADEDGNTARLSVAKSDWDRTIVLRAAKPFPKAAHVQLTFGKGTPSAEGPLTTTDDQNTAFETYAPLALTEHRCGWQDHCPPREPFYLIFNNPLDGAAFDKKWMQVTPEITDLDIQAGGNTITLSGLTQAHETYTVRVAAELRDTFGQVLGHEERVTFSVGAADPELIATAGSIVVADPSKPPTFSAWSAGQEALQVTLRHVEPEDYLAYVAYQRDKSNERGRTFEPPGRIAWSGKVKVASSPDTRSETLIDLRPALSGPTGHVIATIEATRQPKAGEIPPITTWVQVTKLGLAAFADPRSMLAWTNDLATGAPVRGVSLRVLPGGSMSTSDRDGIAHVAYPPADAAPVLGNFKWPDNGNTPPRFLVATRDGDSAILPENPGNWWGGTSWNVREPGSGTLWHVFDDRGLYRPGETARVKGLVRRISWAPDGDVSLVEGESVLHWLLRDSVGNEIAKGDAALSSTGGFDFALELPPVMNLGYAQVEIRLGDSGESTWHQLRVEEFRRPEYEVKLDLTEGPYLLGGDALATATASYLAGGGLPDAPVAWRVTAQRGTFHPPHWDEYAFGPWSPWWMRWSPSSASVRTFTHDAKTDAHGQHALRLAFEKLGSPEATSVEIEATVTDVNRQAWSDRATILVHPSDLWVGVRLQRPFVDRGDALALDVVVTDRDGKALADREVTLRAVRIDSAWGDAGLVEKEVDAVEEVVTTEDDPVTARLVLPRSGSWRIDATTRDDSGRPNRTQVHAWVAGEPVVATRNVEQQPVELIPDAKEYGKGDVAHVLVRAPFAPAEGLLTLRRAGLVREQRFAMKDATQVLDIEIEEGWWPSISAQVDLVGSSPRVDTHGKPMPGEGRPAFATGTIDLAVPPRARVLTVDVAARDATLEPGGTTTLDLHVTDPSGAAAPGEVTVIVADEAVLALTGYELADPLPVFAPARGGDVSDFHLRPLVQLREPPIEGPIVGGVMGGVVMESLSVAGGAADGRVYKMAARAMPAAAPMADMERKEAAPSGPAIALRLDMSALALFAPAVAVGSDGRAQVELKLPDSLTRWRVMAIATSGPRRFGKGESSVTASRKLMVRPSLPRFMNYGDRAELPVVLQNLTDKDLKASVAMRVSNARLDGARGLRVTIPANDRVEVRFPATTDSAGTARVQVVGVAGKLSDAAELSMPVWTPATTEAFATYGTLDKGAVLQPIAVPRDVLPSVGGLSLETSSTALFELGDAMLHLWNYPYGCSEQISSRLLSVLALRDGVAAFSKLPPKDQLDRVVNEDIKTLVERQDWNGDVGLWTQPDRETRRWPWVSIHAAHALVLARDKGYAVPEEAIERSLRFLRDVESRIPKEYGDACRAATIAHALHVQRLAGDAAPQRAERCLALLPFEKHSLETLAFLLPTFHESAAHQAEATRIVQHFRTRAAEEAGTVSFTTGYGDDDWLIMYSGRRTDAVILAALLEVEPESDLAPKILRGLLDGRRNGAWENTQEDCFVMLAMDRYLHAHEASAPDFAATAWLGTTTLAHQEFRGRSTERRLVDVPMAEIVAGPAKQDVVIAREGTGRLYYRLGMSYAPSSLKLDPSQHGFVVERTYEGVDDPHDVSRDEDGTWRVKAGALVRVRVTMVAPARRTHVALVDPLPAGLEALNPDLAMTQSVAPSSGSGGGDWERWAYTGWDHQNLRDERTEAFSAYTWPGVHEHAIVARATTPGLYVVPPAKAEEMYHPETFGRSASDRLRVE